MCAPAQVSGNASQINAALLFLVGLYLFTKIYKTSCLLTLAIKNLELEVSCAFTDGAPCKHESRVMLTRPSANKNWDFCRIYAD